MKQYEVINGNSLEVLDTLAENSVDSIVTDPPYELGFMGKSWDASGIAYNVELWKKALRVLKPGGYLLAFGGSRTFHRIACAIEDAGFEIRDTIMWLYGSGFPKSHNVGLSVDKKLGCSDRGHRIAVANRHHPDGTLEPNGEILPKYEGRTEEGKKWQGYGTALKPAYEPIIVARKPFKGSVADNVLKYGVGGLNIDECRVGNEVITNNINDFSNQHGNKLGNREPIAKLGEKQVVGRWPANVIHDGSEEAIKGMPDSKGASSQNNFSNGHIYRGQSLQESNTSLNGFREWYNDDGSASRYFYCAKASSKDRDEGLDAKQMYSKESGNQFGYGNTSDDNFGDRVANVMRKNIHPTVKPTELMQYLVRLVTPKGGCVLDIFNGSGSTGKAVAFENRERNANYTYIGIELDSEYCKISEARIDYAANKYKYDILDEIKENEKKGQMSLFDFNDYGN